MVNHVLHPSISSVIRNNPHKNNLTLNALTPWRSLERTYFGLLMHVVCFENVQCENRLWWDFLIDSDSLLFLQGSLSWHWHKIIWNKKESVTWCSTKREYTITMNIVKVLWLVICLSMFSYGQPNIASLHFTNHS